MKEEGLKNYISIILQIVYRINSKHQWIINLNSNMSRIFCLEERSYLEAGNIGLIPHDDQAELVKEIRSNIFLKSLTKELFNDIRIDMKSLGVDDIREILKVEVRKSILHSHQVNLGTNKYDPAKVEDSLKSVSSKEEKMKQSLITDYFFGLAEIIIKVLRLKFLERQDKFLKFIS